VFEQDILKANDPQDFPKSPASLFSILSQLLPPRTLFVMRQSKL